MGLEFKQIGRNKSKEIRFKVPTALAEEFDKGRAELKALGVEVDVNEEVVTLLTKINKEIWSYINKQKEGSSSAPETPASPPEN